MYKPIRYELDDGVQTLIQNCQLTQEVNLWDMSWKNASQVNSGISQVNCVSKNWP